MRSAGKGWSKGCPEVAFDVAEMERVLLKQAGAYRELLELAKDKREVILARQTDRLNDIIRDEHALLSRTAALEELRFEVQQRIARRTGLETEALTAVAIIEMLEPGEVQRWQETIEELKGVLSELKAVNDLNRELLGRFLSYVRFLLQVMRVQTGLQNTLIDRQV